MLSASFSAAGQDKFITLTGKIIDSQTKHPIPFVNIQLKSRSIGTATNSEGEFIFKIPVGLSGDTLLLSCIGYKGAEKPVRSAGLNISITLEPATVLLAEVTVNPPSGLDIVKKALAKISENYDTSDVQLTAFYREQLRLGDFEVTNSESVLDIYKTFKTGKKLNDQIRIIKGRKKKIDFGGDAEFYFWISGISNGARSSLAADLIKYHKVGYSPISPKNFKHYNYNYTETIQEGDRSLAVIHILPKKNSRRGIFETRIFIDEESFAIVKYDYETTKRGIRISERQDHGLAYAIMTKVVGATTDYHKIQGSVTFKQYKHKWYLNNVTRHGEILVNSKKRNMVNRPWLADMHLMITDINTENVRPITEGNIGDKEARIGSFISNDQDEAFWENYNILKAVVPDSVKLK
jgi:hypothetical protein